MWRGRSRWLHSEGGAASAQSIHLAPRGDHALVRGSGGRTVWCHQRVSIRPRLPGAPHGVTQNEASIVNREKPEWPGSHPAANARRHRGRAEQVDVWHRLASRPARQVFEAFSCPLRFSGQSCVGDLERLSIRPDLDSVCADDDRPHAWFGVASPSPGFDPFRSGSLRFPSGRHSTVVVQRFCKP